MVMMLARNRTTMVCVTLSLLLTIINAAALHTGDHHLQASNDLANDGHLHHRALPRKLKVNRKVQDYHAKGLVSSSEHHNPSSGDSNKNREERDVIVHAAKGTRQEWIEGSERTHEFFTMDYSHVRRRRPIHNYKSSTKTIINSP